METAWVSLSSGFQRHSQDVRPELAEQSETPKNTSLRKHVCWDAAPQSSESKDGPGLAMGLVGTTKKKAETLDCWYRPNEQ